ncbi:MAG: ATP synthase F1 subunit gamma [Bacilli bacterium]|nr:ATP synthase F1 subunit gamma [Bacilli bacterium]
MSVGLQATKRRIQSVTSTKKITKAMELVATAKLKTWKNTYERVQNYTNSMIQLAEDVFSKVTDCESPFLQENKSDKDLYVVITSNLGLCAGYNYQVYYLLDSLLKENDDVLMIGSKGISHYEGILKERLICPFDNNDIKLDYKSSNKIGKFIIKEFEDKKYRSVKLIYTKYVNSIAFLPKCLKLLPVTLNKDDSKHLTTEYTIFEPSPQEIVNSIIPIYIKSTLYGKLIESQVSEQASRRTAMENASDNSQEIIDKLNIQYNKQRQAAITQDIVEIVGGTINK